VSADQFVGEFADRWRAGHSLRLCPVSADQFVGEFADVSVLEVK